MITRPRSRKTKPMERSEEINVAQAILETPTQIFKTATQYAAVMNLYAEYSGVESTGDLRAEHFSDILIAGFFLALKKKYNSKPHAKKMDLQLWEI